MSLRAAYEIRDRISVNPIMINEICIVLIRYRIILDKLLETVIKKILETLLSVIECCESKYCFRIFTECLLTYDEARD